MVSSLFSEATFSRLEALAKANAEIYRTNSPFPHIAIDDFLPADALDGALAEFPNATDIPWIRFDNPEEKKLAFNEIERLPAALRDVFYFMNSAPVLRFLEELTGIEDLLPDPYYVGGGLHNIRRGGHLGVHVDFNRYKRFGIDRRLNMLVYLNRNWDESYGGHLELWDRGMESCVKRIAPIFNRCVVFSTTETSYHGHPEPLTCPTDRARRSLATYYYTNGRDDEQVVRVHSTVFQRRPGAEDAPRSLLRRLAHQLTPPILVTLAQRLTRK